MKRVWHRVVDRLQYFNSPFVACWFPAYWVRSDVALLRKVVGRIQLRKRRTALGQLILWLKTCVWPLTALPTLLICWSMYYQDAVRIGGCSAWGQLRGLFYFTFWWGYSPMEYYSRRMYREDLRDVMSDFLSHVEVKILDLAVNVHIDHRALKDKDSFEKRCREFDLPIVPLFASCVDGCIVNAAEEQLSELAKSSLYFKPVFGQQGIGIERWDYFSESKKWSFGDQCLNEGDLLLHFKEASREQRYVLQKTIYNHPSIERFSTDGLITFRVITVAGRDGSVEVIAAYMGMPRTDRVANHSEYGGLVVAFDLKKQVFLEVFAKKPVPAVFTKHPETGSLVTGESLDVWPAISELSVQAHRAFPGVFAIGWDIVYTEAGAMLLEGNTQWGSRPGFFVGRNAYARKYLELLYFEKKQGNLAGDLL